MCIVAGGVTQVAKRKRRLPGDRSTLHRVTLLPIVTQYEHDRYWYKNDGNGFVFLHTCIRDVAKVDKCIT